MAAYSRVKIAVHVSKKLIFVCLFVCLYSHTSNFQLSSRAVPIYRYVPIFKSLSIEYQYTTPNTPNDIFSLQIQVNLCVILILT